MPRTTRALFAVLALASASVTIAAAPSASPTPPRTVPGASTAQPASVPVDPSSTSGNAVVTLITGDRIEIAHPGGRSAIITTAADRGPGTAPVRFSTFVLHGDTYVLPSDASAYVGGELDWSLFDVSALVRGGIVDGAPLPLKVRYAAGATGRAMPAITGLSRRSNTTAQIDRASENPKQACAFGRALARQLQVDVARAHGRAVPLARPDLFVGVAHISLASRTAHPRNPAARPDPGYNMQTLTLNAITRDGTRPPSLTKVNTNGIMVVDNVDNPNAFGAIIPVLAHQKWSVPAGTYDIRGFVFTWFLKTIVFTTPNGLERDTVWDSNASFVWDPQVAVRHDRTVTLDARAAKRIRLPLTPDADTTHGWRTDPNGCCNPTFNLVSDRVGRNGEDVPWYWSSGADALGRTGSSLETYLTPSTKAPTEGGWHFYTADKLESPSSGNTYDLVYPSSGGVPATFARAVAKRDLAAIPTTYASEVPNRLGSQERFAYQPWETISTDGSRFITEPLHRTEYVLASPAAAKTLWLEVAAMADNPIYPYADPSFGPYTRYRPGPQAPVQWFEGPRHPGVARPGPVVKPDTLVAGAMTCSLCRNANGMNFDIRPYMSGDGQTWGTSLDTGDPFAQSHIADAQVLNWYEGDTLLSTLTNTTDPALGTAPIALPMDSARAPYRLEYTVDRSAPWSSLSTHTATAWDFTSSAPQHTDRMPAGWSCGALIGRCSFLPLLLLDYRVPLDEHDAVEAPGSVNFTVHVYHQLHSHSTAAIEVPTVSTSFDDGDTWQPVSDVVPVGGGTFRVSINTPDPDSIPGFVSLRVRDTDTAGSDVSQTIVRAFTLAGSDASRGGGVGSDPQGGIGGGGGMHTVRACAAPAAGHAACDAIVQTTASGRPAVTPNDVDSAPAGLAPADLASAYHLPRRGGATQTVAVVDAPGDPNIAADLATYRAQYHLPACTTDSGCLRIVNQAGTGAPDPGGNEGWGMETALDLDMVSASCPHCKILLVVANDSTFRNLAASEQTAARLGADVISNSYGAYEQEGVQNFASAYHLPGVAVVASSGDTGFGLYGRLGGTQFPASLPWVTAVGGTRLVPDAGTSRGWTETAWNGGGSGCSAYFAKPARQPGANCHMRTVADVSAVADPNTGVAVYDSALTTGPGWLVVGGTSASSPIIAGVYGLAGNEASVGTPAQLYRQAALHPGHLYDVVAGSNGSCGSPVNYLCNAKRGYDAPTGLGTPHGIGAF